MNDGRSLVGLGEVLLAFTPGGETIAGLAATLPLLAARMGSGAVCISRVGQDAAGDRVVRTLREQGVNVAAIQYDPDLPTGRLTIRSIAGRISRTLDARAAFDNLQWDFDMEDVAQAADTVVFGELARREAQTRSTIDRFLVSCPQALRIYDLTNRASDMIERPSAMRAASYAQGVVMDEIAVRALAPGDREKPLDTAASSLLRALNVLFIVLFDGRSMRVVSESGVEAAESEIAPLQRDAALVGLIHGVLKGCAWTSALSIASRVAQHVASNPSGPIPDDVLRVA